MTTNNEEKEILQKLVGLIYEFQDYLGFNLEKDRYFGKSSCSCLEDYEEEDMDRFYKEYPYCKIIPYRIMLEAQRFYNGQELDAIWCNAYDPESLIECFERVKKHWEEQRGNNPVTQEETMKAWEEISKIAKQGIGFVQTPFYEETKEQQISNVIELLIDLGYLDNTLNRDDVVKKIKEKNNDKK